jgi:hypothetical protein
MEKNLIFNSCEVFIVFCTLISMISCIIFFSRLDSTDFAYVSSLGKNWSKGPIFSAEASQNCSANQLPLIDDKWGGTRRVCSYGKSLFKSACGKQSKKYIAIAPKPFNYWHGVKICTHRINSTYFDLDIVKRESECRMKSCGIIDSFRNYLCVDQNAQCPYNSLEVIKNNMTLPTDYTYTKISLKDVDMLLAYREKYEKSSPLNQFIIDEQLPCANPYYKNYKTKIFFPENFYERDQCYTGIDNILTDPRAEEIDSYGFWNVYQENGINDYLNIYPGYKEFAINELNSRTLKLYHKGYVGIDTSCLQTIKEKNIGTSMIKELIEFETTLNGWYALPLYAMILSIVSFVLLFLYLFVVIFSIYLENPEDKEMKSRAIMTAVPGAFNMIVLIMALVIKLSSKSELTFAFLAEQQCVDNLSAQGINIAIDAYYNLMGPLNWIIYSNVISHLALLVNSNLAVKN